MIHLILLLLFLTCIGIVAAWVAENPGTVTMTWFDYRIDTSLAFILLATLLTAAALTGLYILFHRVFHAPDALTRRKKARLQEKGLEELTHSIVALAAADTKAAETHTRKAEKLLGRTPLTLLLSAQVARTQGDDARTQLLLEQMLEHKETEYLAARYLSESANKQQHLPKARDMAQRAHALKPQGLEPLLSLHIRLKEWQQAANAVSKALRKGRITRAQLHRYKGIIFLQHAIDLMEQGQDEAALATARQAVKQLPSFLPATLILSRAYLTTQQHAKATSLLLAAWKKQPHLLLAEQFRNAIAPLTKEKQLKLARKFAKTHPDTYASHILLAQTHISAADWAAARNETKKALALQETAQACKLMAEIEMGEYADYDAQGRWLSRSVNALPESSWVCSSCGNGTKQWDSHCPNCNNFDTLAWKQRDLAYVGKSA